MNWLQEAWEKRATLWTEGSKLIEEGNLLWKELSTMPATGAVRVGVWYELSEMSCDAAAKVSKGYGLRLEADSVWHDALVEAKGQKVKLTWVFDDQKKAYGCRLDTGEVFEP